MTEIHYFNNGDVRYHFNDLLHREDGPAIEYFDGGRLWAFHGKTHRIGGPAFISSAGLQVYYLHGLRHREDGPAVIYHEQHFEFFLQGEKYSFEEFFELVSTEAKEKLIWDLDRWIKPSK